MEHVRLPPVGSAREEDVRGFFEGFKVDLEKQDTDGRRAQVLRDHEGWYVAFLTADSAFRAARALSDSGTHKLTYQTVVLTTAPAPALVAAAQALVLKELRAALREDVKSRLMAEETRAAIGRERLKAGGGGGSVVPEKRGLKGLSFRKAKPKVVVEKVEEAVQEPEPEVEVEEGEEEGEVEVRERPKKRRKEVVKKVAARRVVQEVVSEDEAEVEAEVEDGEALEPVRKRTVSEELQEEEQENEPVRKKQK
ncbi:hypothetical protein DXG01_013830, partial [Tephrocybe rancida]